MAKDDLGSRKYHLIDTEFAARQLCRLGKEEMKYLQEVMDGETLSNYISGTVLPGGSRKPSRRGPERKER